MKPRITIGVCLLWLKDIFGSPVYGNYDALDRKKLFERVSDLRPNKSYPTGTSHCTL